MSQHQIYAVKSQASQESAYFNGLVEQERRTGSNFSALATGLRH